MRLVPHAPFKGHGTPKEDLNAIAETIENDEMPPWRYKMIHCKSEITASEAKIIKNWVKDSLKIIVENKR